MIYLDANAFYWYIGREKLAMESSVPKHNVEMLRKFLDSREDKSVPASVLMEMIVHFRDNSEIIKKIIRFREDKGLKVLNNMQGYIFTEDELTALHLTHNDLLKQYAYMLLDKKIEIEVTHAYVFLQVVSLLYADYYIKTFTCLDSNAKEAVLFFIGRDFSNSMREDYCSQLTTALKSGYSDRNRSQQYLKEKYIELLTQNCVIFQMIIDAAVNCLNGAEDLFAVMCAAAATAKANGFDEKNTMNAIVAALGTDSNFLKYAEKQIADIFLRKGYSKHQAQYTEQMLEAWLERGQKLRKNDIFDMLCVGVLDVMENDPSLSVIVDHSSYLVTFDEVMMSFVFKNSWNAKFIGQFLLN